MGTSKLSETAYRTAESELVADRFGFLVAEYGFQCKQGGVASDFTFKCTKQSVRVDVTFAPPELPYLAVSLLQDRQLTSYTFSPAKSSSARSARTKYYKLIDAKGFHEDALELAGDFIGIQTVALRRFLERFSGTADFAPGDPWRKARRTLPATRR